ncbi:MULTISPECIES: hypothetical protein [Ignavibacterium]|jgi:hypothetical protein|uniref:hypothetical protein n=1 Tax=Ignavibacterium TaxID=795750 RepID=UPI0025C0313F|nr:MULTISPECIES: hypothetical protein [Ignavibacterium]MBI5661287.1 hypothetical protein [Ignavibacterium album]
MLKDILKIAHKNGIVLRRDKFVFENKEISFSEFISFINKNKFNEGIEKAILNSKKVLFNDKQ